MRFIFNFNKFLYITGLVLCLWACQQDHLPVPHGPVGDAVPLVFIHGLMGSELVDQNQHVHWLTASQGLGLSSAELQLPLSFHNNIQTRDQLRSRYPLRKVELLPGVGQQIYAPWMQYASQLPEHRLHNFTYDWRRDNNESAVEFRDFLKWISNRYHRPARVVAHSMGGMISRSGMHQGAHL